MIAIMILSTPGWQFLKRSTRRSWRIWRVSVMRPCGRSMTGYVNVKTFAKANIRCGRRRYDNSTAFYEEYFGPDCEKLVDAIKAYRQHNGSHKKDEHYLAELLK